MPVLQTNQCSLQVISCPQKILMGPKRTKLLHDPYGQTYSGPECGLARSIQLHSSPTQTYYEPTHVCMAVTCKHEPSETLETATKMFATKHCLYRISHCEWLHNAQNCLKQVRHFITTRGDVFSSVT